MFAARHEAQPSFTWREQHLLTQLVCLGSNLVLIREMTRILAAQHHHW